MELALAEPAEYTVYELETSGRRMGTVPSEVVDGMVASVVVGTLLVPGLYVLFCGRCNNK